MSLDNEQLPIKNCMNSNANDSLLLSKMSESNNNMKETMYETRTTTEIIKNLDSSLMT